MRRSFWHACPDCGAATEYDFTVCGQYNGKPHRQPAAPTIPAPGTANETPPVAHQAIPQPAAALLDYEEDWADYWAWAREVDLRDREMEEAYRESRYQDMLDSWL